MALETEPDVRMGKDWAKSQSIKGNILDGDQGTGHPLTDDSSKHEGTKSINTAYPVRLLRI